MRYGISESEWRMFAKSSGKVLLLVRFSFCSVIFILSSFDLIKMT